MAQFSMHETTRRTTLILNIDLLQSMQQQGVLNSASKKNSEADNVTIPDDSSAMI